MLRCVMTALTAAVLFTVGGLLTSAQAQSEGDVPQLVRPDGTYPTVPLEKDVVVLKVVQNEPQLLQNAPSIKEGLEENVRRMGHWIDKACTEGKKPDFILFNEFPLTGWSRGTREGEAGVHHPDSGA